MEIYDYADLGNMRSWDYSMNNRIPRDDGIEPIAVTDKEIEMGELLIINNVAYTICSLSGKGNKFQIAYVERVKNQSVLIDGEDPEEQYGTDNITCPYCGYENADSWEADESDDHYECPNCGSYFSYEREVSISYYSSPIEKNESLVIC
mgnify:CR=1 FL=1